MNLIEQLGIENGKKSLPMLCVGDNVRINYLISEGDKERVQPFSGTVIAIRGRGIARSVIVRRLVQGEGVERIFPLHSPRVQEILIERRGRVRRAKLYYLRDRVGKKTRLNELLGDRARRLAARTKESAAQAEETAAAAEAPSPDKESQPVEV